MRRKPRCMASARDLTSSVLANPGTPSRRLCPPAAMAMKTCSITASCPTILLLRAALSLLKPETREAAAAVSDMS